MGARVKVQNNVSLYAGVVVGDDVFLGPGAVVTNVRQPRATRSQRGQYVTTHIGRGATLGAHVTVICGNHVGAHAFLAAGCVLTRPAPPFALMVGVPARRVGWVGHHGVRLVAAGAGQWRCPETGAMYGEIDGALQPAAAAPPPARAEAA